MMNVLRDGCSERGTARVGKRHDLKTVRWYVLTLPTTGVARRDKISPAKSLDAELSRRKRRGETLFEYFAPSYVEEGRWTERWSTRSGPCCSTTCLSGPRWRRSSR